MTTYRVDIPLDLTFEVEITDAGDAGRLKEYVELSFQPVLATDALEGIRFKLLPPADHLRAVIRMAIATGEAKVM